MQYMMRPMPKEGSMTAGVNERPCARRVWAGGVVWAIKKRSFGGGMVRVRVRDGVGSAGGGARKVGKGASWRHRPWCPEFGLQGPAFTPTRAPPPPQLLPWGCGRLPCCTISWGSTQGTPGLMLQPGPQQKTSTSSQRAETSPTYVSRMDLLRCAYHTRTKCEYAPLQIPYCATLASTGPVKSEGVGGQDRGGWSGHWNPPPLAPPAAHSPRPPHPAPPAAWSSPPWPW
jgi:hypothetical protein